MSKSKQKTKTCLHCGATLIKRKSTRTCAFGSSKEQGVWICPNQPKCAIERFG